MTKDLLYKLATLTGLVSIWIPLVTCTAYVVYQLWEQSHPGISHIMLEYMDDNANKKSHFKRLRNLFSFRMLAYSATSIFRLFDIFFLTFLLNSNFQTWQNSSIWSLRELIWGHFPYSFQRFTCGYLFFKLFYIISRGKEMSLNYFYYKHLLVDNILRLFCLLGISVKFYFYLSMCVYIYIYKNFINGIFFVPCIF